MSSRNRRELLEAAAAASALIALGSRAQASPLDPPGVTWTRSVCRSCDRECGLYVGARDGKVVAVKGDPDDRDASLRCPKGFVLPHGCEGTITVAGVLLVTAPGSGPRVAARLAAEPGLSLTGGDGDARIAAVWAAANGATLEGLSERLLASDPEIRGVFPTFVARDAAR
jgi:hypothetical protein